MTDFIGKKSQRERNRIAQAIFSAAEVRMGADNQLEEVLEVLEMSKVDSGESARILGGGE